MITKRQIKKGKDVKNKTLDHKKLMKEANTQTGMMIRQEKKQQKKHTRSIQACSLKVKENKISSNYHTYQ